MRIFLLLKEMFNLYSWQVQCLLPRRKTKMPASQDFSAHTRSSSGQNVIRSHRTGGIKPHLRTFTFEMSAPTMQGKTELWNGRGHTEQRSSYLLPSFAADTSAKSFKRAATALARHIRTLSKKKKEPCFIVSVEHTPWTSMVRHSRCEAHFATKPH